MPEKQCNKRGTAKLTVLPRISHNVCLCLIAVTTCASLLLGSVRLQHRQPCHLTGIRKRQSKAVTGGVYFGGGHAWATRKWWSRPGASVRLGKLSGRTNSCPASLLIKTHMAAHNLHGTCMCGYLWSALPAADIPCYSLPLVVQPSAELMPSFPLFFLLIM